MSPIKQEARPFDGEEGTMTFRSPARSQTQDLFARSNAPSAMTVEPQPRQGPRANLNGTPTRQIFLPNSARPTGTSPESRVRANASSTSTADEPMLMEVRNRDPPPAAQPEAPFAGQFNMLGKNLVKYVKTLGELQAIGVSHELQAPELVLVGDQSAGKSSLMSSLADVRLPQSEGTCTRCPTHIRSSRSHTWECRVSLQSDYTCGNPADRSHHLSPWVPLGMRQTQHFRTIYDASELTETLRWAQIAILNDGEPYEQYIPGSGHTALESSIAVEMLRVRAKFSPNLVALEIKGPDVPELNYYDLPGIFLSAAHAEDQYLVRVVENLAKEYIKRQNAIILWAVPMNADPETSRTFSLINDCNATDRTIGVMTKADLLPAGGHHQWVQMLRGLRHRVEIGYFITSSSREASDLQEQLKWEERLFFDDATTLWPTVEFAEFRDRCGILKLAHFLEGKLGREFQQKLPKIRQTIQQKLNANAHALSQLRSMPSNAEHEVIMSLTNFGHILQNLLRPGFTTDWKSLADKFRDCIVNGKPRITLTHPSDPRMITDSSDEAATPQRKRQRTGRQSVTPSTNRSAEQLTPSASETPTNGNRNTRPPQRLPPNPHPFSRWLHMGKGFFSLDTIAGEIRAKIPAGHHDLVPIEIYSNYCVRAVQPWTEPTYHFLEQSTRNLKKTIMAALEDDMACGKLKNCLLYRELAQKIQDYVAGIANDYKDKQLAELLQLEKEHMYVANSSAFDAFRKRELDDLKRHRHIYRWATFNGIDMPAQLPRLLTAEDRARDEAERARQLEKLGPDTFTKELEIAAYVRAYYLNSAHRFVEMAAMHIANGMIPRVRRELKDHLLEQLELTTTTGDERKRRCEALLEENEESKLKRDRLRAEESRFTRALQSIAELERLEALEQENGIANGVANGNSFIGTVTTGPARGGSPIGSVVSGGLGNGVRSVMPGTPSGAPGVDV